LSRVTLCVGDVAEACPLNLAPTASTTAMLALGDALAMCVSRRRRFGVEDFRKFHPGGALGRQLMPVVARILDMSKFSLLIMLFITYTAVGILTLNSMLMGVFERIHEFGIIKALGVPPWQIFSLITMETILQTLFASILALVTAVPLSIYCETHPVDLTSLASTSASIAGIALDPLWYCRVTAESVITPVLVLFAVSLVAIIYPAGKAALIRPLQAIYHR
jgi:putative ABC transport system permease protein